MAKNRVARRPVAVMLGVWCMVFASIARAGAGYVADPIRFDSIGDYGNVGFLQNPSARMAPDGQLTLAYSRVWPYDRYAVTMQAMPWLEATLRYTSILNRRYGPVAFSGDQPYKDRGFDIKLRLIEESRQLPEVSIGLRDVLGTGLFAGEYIVANRRYHDWDFMLGLGWGSLGSRGHFRNPMRSLSDTFKTRQRDVGRGGKIDTQTLFSGEKVSLLAAVSYRTPIEGLTLKAELDGNDYASERSVPVDLGKPMQPVKSPINIGGSYKLNNWVDMAFALERGNTLMFQLVFKENLKSSDGFPKFDPPPEPVKTRARVVAGQVSAGDEQRIMRHLEAKGFTVDQLDWACEQRHLTAHVSQNTWASHARAAGRAGRAIANTAPPGVEKITIANLESGVETYRVSMMRRDLELAEIGMAAAEDMWQQAGWGAPKASGEIESVVRNPDRYPAFHWGWSPALRQHIGGPDNPLFFQLYINVNGELQLTRGLSMSGSLGFDVYNNFADLKLVSDSVLPRVRSDIKDYLKQGANNIARLQADYVRQFSESLYGKVSGGIFEEMYAGWGGELLYRPYGKRWSMGANLYKAYQRDFDQRFKLRDYRVTTGHVELNYRLPFYGLETTISAGRYLAGDKGMTFQLARQFENGARFGGFFTLTNVSADQFGEGSFDKGIFLSFPLERISLFSTRRQFNMGWRPLTRDGGQKLAVGKPLSGLVSGTDPDQLMTQWPSVLK